MTQRKQIEKEAARMGVSADTYQQSKLLNIDPELKKLGQMEEYKAQMEDFKVSIGQNLLPMMTSLMGVMTPVSQFFKEYPTVSKYAAGLLIASKAGSGLLQTFSIYKQSQSMNFMRRAQADAIGLGSSMSAAERKAIGLKGRLSSAAGTFGFVLKFAVYGIALEKLFELFSEMKAAREAWDNVGKLSGELNTSMAKDIADSKKRAADYIKRGLPVPAYLEESYSPKRMLEQASNTLTGLNTSDMPKGAVGFLNRAASYVPGAGGFGGGSLKEILKRGSIDQGVEMVSSRASELQNPELMGAYRAKMFARKDVTPEMAYKSDVILHKFNPAAFAQSHVETIRMTAALAAEMGTAQQSIKAISPPAMDTATALYNLHIPAMMLPDAFNNARAAIQNFESAVASINLTPPPPVGVSGGNSLFGLDGWKASGGPVRKNRSYMVGERGREIFTPHENGFITPNHQLSRQSPGDWLKDSLTIKQSLSDSLNLPYATPFRHNNGQKDSNAIPARVTQPWRHVSARDGGSDKDIFRPRPEVPALRGALNDTARVTGKWEPPGAWLKHSEAAKSVISPETVRSDRLKANAQPSIFPSKASGGMVERGGFVHMHDKEAIVPARVTRRWRDSENFTPNYEPFRQSSDVRNALAPEAVSGAINDNSASERHFNITLNVTGDVKDPERLSNEIVSKLEAKIAALDRKTNSVRHFNRTGVRALEIGEERG
jgi:hypothetical protein